MKKLMTMIAAVATAFGLFADDPQTYDGTSFESAEGVTELKWTPTSGYPAGTWSTNPTIEDALDLGAYETEGSAYVYPTGAPRRDGSVATEPRAFAGGTANANFLKLDTGSATVDRAVADGQVFYDQVIKFTGFEDMQTNFVEGTKIALWTSAIEDDEDTEEANEADTNLYVAVGTGTDSTNVKIDVSLLADEFDFNAWHRVTIKNAGVVSGNYLGFFVWIDGKMATIVSDEREYFNGQFSAFKSYYDKGQLFISMDGTSATVEKIGFQGVGSLDDVVVSKDGPAFAVLTVDVTFKEIPGAVIAKVEDADGVVGGKGGTYSVKPGDITVTLAPAAGYKMMKGTGVYKLKASAAGELTIPADEDAYALVAAIVVNNNVTNEYAETELYGMINGLVNGDEVEFKDDADIWADEDNQLYSFPKDSTITVSVANDVTTWAVVVAGEGVYAYDYVGTTANFIKNYTFEDENSSLVLNGNVVGKVSAATVYTMLAIEVSGTLRADSLEPIDYITISGEGKVVTMTGELTDWFLPEDDVEVKKNTPEADWYTYQLSTAPTGFMLLIGEAEPVTYPTLEEAVAAVGATTDPVTIKFYENAVLTARVDVAKNMTLDLNGKNISMAGDTAKVKQLIKVINGATLTINGTNSTVTGLICVGRKLTDQPVENAALVINGGTYQVGDNTAIHVQGDCTAAAVTINDATIISELDNGIQFNGKGTYAINNSSVTGYTAIYVKGGTLAIDGKSVITANGAERITPTPNGNGSNKTGDAIVLDTHSSYQGDISLTLAEGAQVSSTAGAAILETVTLGSASATMSIADNGADVTAPIGLQVSPKFAERVAAGLATVTGYIATVDGIGYKDVATALAAVQAKEVGDNYTIQVVILADNTEISNGAQVIVLDEGDAITITKGSWVFNNGVTITGAIALAEGASITVKNAIANYDELITAPDGFHVIETSGEGVYTYSLEADPTALFPTAASVAAYPSVTQDGSAANPWLLTCYDDLVVLQSAVAAGDAQAAMNFKQTDDIDFTGKDPWTGIGTAGAGKTFADTDKVFTGSYDGDNKTISNLKFTARKYAGFFNAAQGGTIKNLFITSAAEGVFPTDATGEFGGGLLAGGLNGVTVQNVTVDGTLTTTHNAAGFAARVIGTSAFVDCTNKVAVTNSEAGQSKAAGFVAVGETGTITFTNCENDGNIAAANCTLGGVSAFLGQTTASLTFNNCVAKGTLTGGNADVVGSFYGRRDNNQGKDLALVIGDGCIEQGCYKTVGNYCAAGDIITGGYFAIDNGDDSVTVTTPATAIASAVAYNVMLPANNKTAHPNFTLTDAAASLALDTTVAAYTGTVSVDPTLEGYELKTETTDNVTTYTVAATTYTITFATDRGDKPADMTYKVTDTFPIKLPTIELSGATFKGWTNETYTSAITELEKPATLGNIALVAEWEQLTGEPAKVLNDLDGTIPADKEEQALANATALVDAKGDAAGVAAWVKTVYGEGNKIPAAKLANASAENVALAVAFDVPVMVEPTISAPVVAEKTTGPAAFEFAIKDGATEVEIKALTDNVKKIVKYAAALGGTNTFAPAKDTEVAIGLDEGKIKAEFVPGPTAGFMKADFTK